MPEASTTPFKIIAAVVAFAAIPLFFSDRDRAERDNARERPFDATVLQERLLCPEGKGCIQVINVDSRRGKLEITNSEEPWVEQGDRLKLIRVHQPGAQIPVGTRYGTSRGSALGASTSYEIHDRMRSR